MTYKMIVLDMDDTLMTSENKVSPKTEKALKAAAAQGVKIVLASGRPTGGMMPTAEFLELKGNASYILSYNGAIVTDMSDQSVLDSKPVTKSQFDEIYDYLKSKGLFILTYVGDTIYAEGAHHFENVESELTGLKMVKQDDLKAFIQGDVPKVMGVGDECIIKQLNDELDGSFGDDIHVTTSKPFFLEFMNENVSKGKILKSLTESININPEEIIAFGDSNNDKDMIEFAGLGVAMGNANDAIKAVADEITEDHNHDGIQKMIEKYILNQ